MKERDPLSRRRFLAQLGGLAGASLLLPAQLRASDAQTITKAIPATGERLPVIGMGTSRTFDAAGDAAMMLRLGEVLQAFFTFGGTVVDSSPMYGTAERVIGRLRSAIESPENLFAATKVWIDGQQAGVEQMEQSRRLWGVDRFDLMQIHNLRDWQRHLETLVAMKAERKVRYIGVTTSHGRDHAELASLLENQPFDFVQLSYNIANRAVEQRLLPIAKERGIAVIVNRPFARGSLFGRVKGKALPVWAQEIDCDSWAQYFLKYIVSHPAVTCAIPATSKVRHMKDNMGAGFGRLPDAKRRLAMESYLRTL